MRLKKVHEKTIMEYNMTYHKLSIIIMVWVFFVFYSQASIGPWTYNA